MFYLEQNSFIEDSWSIKICPSISEKANLSPKTNILFLCKVFTHTGPNINGKTCHTHAQTHTHTHSSSPFYLISDLWHLHTSDQTNTHTASHTNKIKHTPNRWRESRFKEVYSERPKRFESRQEVGTWQE